MHGTFFLFQDCRNYARSLIYKTLDWLPYGLISGISGMVQPGGINDGNNLFNGHVKNN